MTAPPIKNRVALIAGGGEHLRAPVPGWWSTRHALYATGGCTTR